MKTTTLTTIILASTLLINVGCSSKDMYTTGTTINKILPRYGTLGAVSKMITDPLKANEEEKMRKIAKAKRLQKEKEYREWFNSLSKEEQQKIIAKKQQDIEKSNRFYREVFQAMISSGGNSGSSNGLPTPQGGGHIYYKKDGTWDTTPVY